MPLYICIPYCSNDDLELPKPVRRLVEAKGVKELAGLVPAVFGRVFGSEYNFRGEPEPEFFSNPKHYPGGERFDLYCDHLFQWGDYFLLITKAKLPKEKS